MSEDFRIPTGLIRAATWGRLMTENFLETVTGANRYVYGLYHLYEGDYTKPFGFAFAAESMEQPTGLEAISVPAGRYLVFTSRRGPPAEIVGEIWQTIWNWFAGSDVQRAYQYDYEQYDRIELAGGAVSVKIYISIR